MMMFAFVIDQHV